MIGKKARSIRPTQAVASKPLGHPSLPPSMLRSMMVFGNRPEVSMSNSVFIASSSQDFSDLDIEIEPCDQSECAPRHALD